MTRIVVCATCETIIKLEDLIGGGSDMEIVGACCEACDRTTVGSRRPYWMNVPKDAKILRLVFFK